MNQSNAFKNVHLVFFPSSETLKTHSAPTIDVMRESLPLHVFVARLFENRLINT